MEIRGQSCTNPTVNPTADPAANPTANPTANPRRQPHPATRRPTRQPIRRRTSTGSLAWNARVCACGDNGTGEKRRQEFYKTCTALHVLLSSPTHSLAADPTANTELICR